MNLKTIGIALIGLLGMLVGSVAVEFIITAGATREYSPPDYAGYCKYCGVEWVKQGARCPNCQIGG